MKATYRMTLTFKLGFNIARVDQAAEARPLTVVTRSQRFNPAMMERVSRWLEAGPDDASMAAVLDGVSGKSSYIRDALRALVAGGNVQVSGSQPRRVYRSVAPYRAAA